MPYTRRSARPLTLLLMILALLTPMFVLAPTADALPAKFFQQSGTVPILRSEFELPPDQIHSVVMPAGLASVVLGLDHFTPNEPDCDNPAVSNGCFGKDLDLRLIQPNGIEYGGASIRDIPLGEHEYVVPNPMPGTWTMIVNADSFYVWYDIDYSVYAELMCGGKRITIDMNLNGGNGTGTPGDDVIWGTSGADQIASGDGNDSICANGGNDVVLSGNGNDYVRAGAGNDTVFGGFGVDRIYGEAGLDELNGDGGSDRIWGGADDDVVRAGSGADRVWGGSGNDELRGMGGKDTMFGQGGNDMLQGNFQSDRLYGGPGNDRIAGAEGKDKLYGGPGDDLMFGGVNTDWLDGGDGIDVANGQKGKDNPFVQNVSGCVAETKISC